jgi:hypothetical protein
MRPTAARVAVAWNVGLDIDLQGSSQLLLDLSKAESGGSWPRDDEDVHRTS